MAWPGLGCICLNEFPVLFERALQGRSPRQPCDSSYSAVLWTSLSSAWPIRACCLTWSSTTSPNPDSVDLFQSSPKIKNSRAGKRKRCKKPCSVPFVGTVSHPSFRLSQLLPRVPKESLGKEPAFLHERQGKKLTFLAIQSSPYSPASHFSSAVIQECSAQLFSLKYQTLQRGEKKKSLQQWPKRKTILSLWTKWGFRFQVSSNIQQAVSSVLSAQNVKKQKEAPSQWTCCPGRARRHPRGRRAGRKCAASAQPRPLRAAPAHPAHPANNLPSVSSNQTCLQPKPNHVSEPESNMETSPLPRNALTNPNFIDAKLGNKSEQRTVQEEMR